MNPLNNMVNDSPGNAQFYQVVKRVSVNLELKKLPI